MPAGPFPRYSGWSISDGVLTFTADLFLNPAQAASMDDAVSSSTVTVTKDVNVAVSGKVTIVVVVTPDAPITGMPDYSSSVVRDSNNPSQ